MSIGTKPGMHWSDESQTEAPSLTPAATRRRIALPLAGAAVVVAALVTGVTLFFAGDGRLGAIADPSSRSVAAVHAEAAGVGAGLTSHGRARNTAAQEPVGPSDGPMETVTYVVQTGGTFEDIGRIFGMPVEALLELNPGTTAEQFHGPGESVIVYEPGVALEPIPYGTEDKLFAGVPMPDGPGRRVRRRRTSWGTSHAVFHLDAALTAYGQAYPEGPVIIVSDLSRREGGRLLPHHAHRTGRDVDISYVPKPDQDNGGFLMMNSWAFDRERNWSFLEALLGTGQVELILMDRNLQRYLVEHLEDKLPEEELQRLFQVPRPQSEEVGIIRHWDGHRDHMHVRLRCASDQPRCP